MSSIAVYANPMGDFPNALGILTAPSDIDIDEAAMQTLGSIPYYIVDSSFVNVDPYLSAYRTLEAPVAPATEPTLGYALTEAKAAASAQNAAWFQFQFDGAMQNLNFAPYQVGLAISTPEGERTASQVAAVEVLSGLNELQAEAQANIDAATTGAELVTILTNLGIPN